MTNEEAGKYAVTKAYNKGYAQGKNDVKGMVMDAFEIWEKALEKSSLHVPNNSKIKD